jgi:hypothetical protein
VNLEEFKGWLKENEPDEDVLREYLLDNCHPQGGHTVPMYDLVYLKQEGKFQGVQKLRLIIMMYNMINELVLLDRILSLEGDSSSYLMGILAKELVKVHGRVSIAGKYSMYDHILTIDYKAVRKGK